MVGALTCSCVAFELVLVAPFWRCVFFFPLIVVLLCALSGCKFRVAVVVFFTSGSVGLNAACMRELLVRCSVQNSVEFRRC